MNTTLIASALSFLFAASISGADAQPAPQPQQTPKPQTAEETRLTILGAVNRPGTYSCRFPVTLLELVGMAGGFSRDANPLKIGVRSNGDKLTFVAARNAKSVSLNLGDVITVFSRNDAVPKPER